MREIPLHFRCILQRGEFGAQPAIVRRIGRRGQGLRRVPVRRRAIRNTDCLGSGVAPPSIPDKVEPSIPLAMAAPG